MVAAFIGLALLAFILTDLVGSGQSMFGGQNQTVAKVNGEKVSIGEYQNMLNEFEDYAKLSSGRGSLDENTMNRLRDQVWNQMIQQLVMGEKYVQLGLTVTPDEIFDMVAGKNVHPSIRQMFTNPQTGVFDQAQVINFLQNKGNDPQANFYWSFLEKQLKNERLMTKYATLVKAGMFVTDQQAKSEAAAKASEVDFNYLVVRYQTISDSLIKVSDSEIKKYYNNHQSAYKVDPSRDIEYVTFMVKPSDEDRQATFDWVNNQRVQFANPATDAIQFVNMNSETPDDNRYLKLEQYSTELQRFIAGAALHDVFGPYLEAEAYKLSRLVDIKQMPDSVKARHILIRNNAPERNVKLADSLLSRVRMGDDFAALARQYSQDPSSAINGGDLGWFAEGMMVQPFNDACFTGNKGDVVKVETQFGLHIIQILEVGKPVTKYNVATLDRKIDYSQKTYQMVYAQATRFASENNNSAKFNAAIEKDNLVKRYGRDLKSSDYTLAALESPRELIKWAFTAKKGDLSQVYEFGSEFVIATLTGIQEKGYTPVKEVSAQISRELRNQKKAEQIKANIQSKGASSIDQLATLMGTTVESATDINFGSFQVPGAGAEPALVAVATATAEGQMSKPVAGNNGVYVVKVNQKSPTGMTADAEKVSLKQQIGFKVDYQLMQSLATEANVDDNRIDFY